MWLIALSTWPLTVWIPGLFKTQRMAPQENARADVSLHLISDGLWML